MIRGPVWLTETAACAPRRPNGPGRGDSAGLHDRALIAAHQAGVLLRVAARPQPAWTRRSCRPTASGAPPTTRCAQACAELAAAAHVPVRASNLNRRRPRQCALPACRAGVAARPASHAAGPIRPARSSSDGPRALGDANSRSALRGRQMLHRVAPQHLGDEGEDRRPRRIDEVTSFDHRDASTGDGIDQRVGGLVELGGESLRPSPQGSAARSPRARRRRRRATTHPRARRGSPDRCRQAHAAGRPAARARRRSPPPR